MREPLVASNDLDGLPVYDLNAVPIGATFGVLAEAETGLVRFFDVAIDGQPRHVLVPVGHARVESFLGRARLRLRAVTARELDRIPAYEPHISWHDDAFQNELLQAYGRLFDGQRYYAHPAYDHGGLYAGAHPLLHDALAPPVPGGLQRLSATRGFRMAENEPDVRTWNVVDEMGAHAGVVTDLLIDPGAEQVRYIVLRRAGDGKETAVPIGFCDLADGAVRVPLVHDDLLALPVLAAGVLARPAEVQLRTMLDSRLSGTRRYARPEFRRTA